MRGAVRHHGSSSRSTTAAAVSRARSPPLAQEFLAPRRLRRGRLRRGRRHAGGPELADPPSASLARWVDAAGRDMARLRDCGARGDVLLDVLHRAVDLLDQAALLAIVDARLVRHAVEARDRARELVVLAQL